MGAVSLFPQVRKYEVSQTAEFPWSPCFSANLAQVGAAMTWDWRYLITMAKDMAPPCVKRKADAVHTAPQQPMPQSLESESTL